MGLISFFKKLHANERGDLFQTFLIAGAIAVPLVIVAVAFGSDLIKILNTKTGTAQTESNKLKWESKTGG